MEQSVCRSPTELMKKQNTDRVRDKANFQREEWFRWLMRVRNDAFIIMSIICLQLPFELAYAHLYEVIGSDLLKFCLTAVYLLAIQYFTRMGGKISVKLIKYENDENVECRANSLVIENILENSIPYLSYSFKKFRARNKLKREQGSSSKDKPRPIPRVEKEYLKPAYAASIDFLELVLQFGMIMMFACAFPLAFAFAAVNNIAEIRADALKLLVMMKRPIPRADATIGAALLACMYDREGKWSLSPGLAAILIMEHVLLFIKFGFSRIVPEEPAWVREARRKNATQAEQMCSKQLLRSISGDENWFREIKKNE
ncbi:anoctamin-like protein at1g73020 [Phtheirospermum japonicum]|uniref:Anoctamin-like protein at1g73020 n=1 Tax=Phtheirospermum japonicum TaxID=374723 RepID=A0A830BER8_9LAMI|nr:anoctamin-like protein at1g73020 [Phtheirospermum japonicum]